MSHEIPVFAAAVDCAAVPKAISDWNDAARLLPTDPQQVWQATSRNWWYQGLVGQLIDAYGGLEELRYLTEIVAVVPAARIEQKHAAIQRLLAAIRQRPQVFVERTTWWGATAEEVLGHMDQAFVSRDFDDDDTRFGNFFCFLASQAAALDEARGQNKCLLYFQPQP